MWLDAVSDDDCQGDDKGTPEEAECPISPQASPTCYTQRSEEFRKLFKDLPESEMLVMDCACALQRDILLQGRLYLSEGWLCFHTNVFRGTTLKVPLKIITAVSREKTAIFIPNAIQICTDAEKFFFTSFSSREKSFQSIFRMWQNTLLDKPLTKPELWHMVLLHYGGDVGLSREDMENVLVSEATNQTSMAARAAGEEHAGRRERPTSLRILPTSLPSGGRGSPAGEEPQSSSLSGGGSVSTEGSRSPASRHRTSDTPFDRTAPERASKRLEVPLDRTAPERASKRLEVPLDRTAPERASKRLEVPLDRTTPERASKRLESPLDQTTSERGSKRSHSPLDRSSSERGSKCPETTLDLNDNEDRVTEGSSSESVEDDESICPAPVQGKVYINRLFHLSAEKMFELLFTDSPFIRRFMATRKVTGITFTPWQKNASGNMKRTLNYTVTINNPLIGKSTTATETQTLYRDTQVGQHYLVEAEVYTHDVPYHDYFYTLNRFCISHNSKHECHLRVYTDVKYKRQPWGLVKSFIAKNSWSGLADYFRHLEAELLEEVESVPVGGDSKAGGVRRRRRTYSRSVPEHFKTSKQFGVEADLHRDRLSGSLDRKGPQRWNIGMIVVAMSFILLILTILNLSLFLKLWAMEDVAQRMYLSTKQRLRERVESSLTPEAEPRRYPPLRDMEETHLLRSVLQDSIDLLEQLRSSLVLLQQSFNVQNETGPPD
ncbi:protein Aster-C isoform X3 [Brienomyrus brachyistius]|uniref:protein Aster-C isoform X2 n=1 Tax=Brienomyrus brachyistius TaxID=42636 RepID=UPI0020B28E16|nr:protein Aster-C isoform X2 [Brienomyrus brachyistius]XP_048866018.1 protein Aster-C isoform X3 [Brienomyrus brachyistius]